MKNELQQDEVINGYSMAAPIREWCGEYEDWSITKIHGVLHYCIGIKNKGKFLVVPEPTLKDTFIYQVVDNEGNNVVEPLFQTNMDYEQVECWIYSKWLAFWKIDFKVAFKVILIIGVSLLGFVG
jgi:hypothetical protein